MLVFSIRRRCVEESCRMFQRLLARSFQPGAALARNAAGVRRWVMAFAENVGARGRFRSASEFQRKKRASAQPWELVSSPWLASRLDLTLPRLLEVSLPSSSPFSTVGGKSWHGS